MENITLVKISDLTGILDQIALLRKELADFSNKQDELKAFTIQQTAEMLNLHYNSVRKMILKGTLQAKYIHGNSGKCIIPLTAVKTYLQSKNSK
jgi:excisionase family DNA binding protein